MSILISKSKSPSTLTPPPSFLYTSKFFSGELSAYSERGVGKDGKPAAGYMWAFEGKDKFGKAYSASGWVQLAGAFTHATRAKGSFILGQLEEARRASERLHPPQAGVSVTKPAITKPVATKSVATKPAAIKPVVTKSVAVPSSNPFQQGLDALGRMGDRIEKKVTSKVNQKITEVKTVIGATQQKLTAGNVTGAIGEVTQYAAKMKYTKLIGVAQAGEAIDLVNGLAKSVPGLVKQGKQTLQDIQDMRTGKTRLSKKDMAAGAFSGFGKFGYGMVSGTVDLGARILMPGQWHDIVAAKSGRLEEKLDGKYTKDMTARGIKTDSPSYKVGSDVVQGVGNLAMLVEGGVAGFKKAKAAKSLKDINAAGGIPLRAPAKVTKAYSPKTAPVGGSKPAPITLFDPAKPKLPTPKLPVTSPVKLNPALPVVASPVVTSVTQLPGTSVTVPFKPLSVKPVSVKLASAKTTGNAPSTTTVPVKDAPSTQPRPVNQTSATQTPVNSNLAIQAPATQASATPNLATPNFASQSNGGHQNGPFGGRNYHQPLHADDGSGMAGRRAEGTVNAPASNSSASNAPASNAPAPKIKPVEQIKPAETVKPAELHPSTHTNKLESALKKANIPFDPNTLLSKHINGQDHVLGSIKINGKVHSFDLILDQHGNVTPHSATKSGLVHKFQNEPFNPEFTNAKVSMPSSNSSGSVLFKSPEKISNENFTINPNPFPNPNNPAELVKAVKKNLSPTFTDANGVVYGNPEYYYHKDSGLPHPAGVPQEAVLVREIMLRHGKTNANVAENMFTFDGRTTIDQSLYSIDSNGQFVPDVPWFAGNKLGKHVQLIPAARNAARAMQPVLAEYFLPNTQMTLKSPVYRALQTYDLMTDGLINLPDDIVVNGLAEKGVGRNFGNPKTKNITNYVNSVDLNAPDGQPKEYHPPAAVRYPPNFKPTPIEGIPFVQKPIDPPWLSTPDAYPGETNQVFLQRMVRTNQQIADLGYNNGNLMSFSHQYTIGGRQQNIYRMTGKGTDIGVSNEYMPNYGEYKPNYVKALVQSAEDKANGIAPKIKYVVDSRPYKKMTMPFTKAEQATPFTEAERANLGTAEIAAGRQPRTKYVPDNRRVTGPMDEKTIYNKDGTVNLNPDPNPFGFYGGMDAGHHIPNGSILARAYWTWIDSNTGMMKIVPAQLGWSDLAPMQMPAKTPTVPPTK